MLPSLKPRQHGLSINFDLDLDNYQKIDPCGLNSKDISSLKELKINYNKVKIYKDLKEEFINEVDLVVVKDSLNSKFVKRVMWVDDEKFKVVSDNKNYPSHITDKALSKDNLIGKVILKF